MIIWLKLILIFIAGIIETILYTGHLLAVDKRNIISASSLMFIYMFTYLTIISWVIKDSNSILMIFVYCLSCAVGVYIRMKYEKDKKLSKISK